MSAHDPLPFLACNACGRPDVCEKLGECNLLIPPVADPKPLLDRFPVIPVEPQEYGGVRFLR